MILLTVMTQGVLATSWCKPVRARQGPEAQPSAERGFVTYIELSKDKKHFFLRFERSKLRMPHAVT